MSEQNIKCPHCENEFSLDETLSSRIEAGVKAEKERARAEYNDALRKKESEYGAREAELKRQSEERLEADRARMKAEAEERAKERSFVEIRALKEEKDEQARSIAELRSAELENRRKTRELEEKGKNQEIEMERKLDVERNRIKAEAADLFSEEHRLKDAEKDKKLSDMSRQVEEMNRKLQQGSMQTQGEVLELELEEQLGARFRSDTIEPVPKGIRGADILQRVSDDMGRASGTIVWELKRAKNWSEGWIGKLKDDQRAVKAEVAVLVTAVLPDDITGFAFRDGVWVTSIGLAVQLASALRTGLIQTAHARSSADGKGERMEVVYNYLTGPEFTHKIEAIVEAFRGMKDDLEKEKRAFAKIWSSREKQIDRVIINTTTLYGDIQGITGGTLPEIKSLELDSGEDELF
ncbi:MAG: DUF2130 domain-containing protein [Proteobacteria bacterium]|nr:DUF2130 domain-containing protein [Pseudomonadota bacterium]